MNRRMLLITGPQGSGNHMFAKLFALHPDVFGWKSLNETYWIGHDQEPFNCLWVDPTKWESFDFGNYQYAVASISCPYVQQGETVLPDYHTFIAQARLHGWQVQVVVIGRDVNILGHQQERLRSRKTFPMMLEHLNQVLAQYNPEFVSHELAVLYGAAYLQSLARSWDFPIAWQDPKVNDILKDNANQKYFQAVKHHWVDDLAIQGLASTARPGTEWYKRDQQIIKNKGES